MPGAGLAVLTKMRPEHNRAETLHFIGDVREKIAIVVDDMIDTAGPSPAAVDTLYENGASEVYVTATTASSRPGLRAHPHLAGQGGRGHGHAEPVGRPARRQDQVLSVADTLAHTIKNVFEDESVSELFAGENQLF